VESDKFNQKHPAYIVHLLSVVAADYFSAKLLKMLNESKMMELIGRQKETGLTITAFCVSKGIARSTFFYWRKKLNKAPVKGFIPLLVNSTPGNRIGASKNYIQEQRELHKSGDDFLLELIYLNGTRFRIKRDPDLDHIRSFVCLPG
jgi:hypothetical protein